MSDIHLLCSLQGVKEAFYVVVDEFDTIDQLKAAILFRKKRRIRGVYDVNKFKIWKVFVPIDDTSGLKKNPSEVKNPIELNDGKLNLNTIWKNNNIEKEHIQVFMGEDVKNIPSPEDEIKSLKELIAQMQTQIRELVDR